MTPLPFGEASRSFVRSNNRRALFYLESSHSASPDSTVRQPTAMARSRARAFACVLVVTPEASYPHLPVICFALITFRPTTRAGYRGSTSPSKEIDAKFFYPSADPFDSLRFENRCHDSVSSSRVDTLNIERLLLSRSLFLDSKYGSSVLVSKERDRFERDLEEVELLPRKCHVIGARHAGWQNYGK